MTNYPRGSEWRKWDLHVHTPCSYLNNQFGSDFDNYVRQLFTKAIEKEIAVIGITDYFTIEGYKKIKQDYLENEGKLNKLFNNDGELIEKVKKILVLPNIEFRLNKLVGTNRINFHVIFSNKVSCEDIEENFLREIKFVYQGNPQYEDEKRSLTIRNLEKLGACLKQDHEKFRDKPEIEVGMMNAVVDDSDIIKILTNKKSIFEGEYLLFIPADEDLSKIQWDGQDHQTRKVLIQKSDGLFSSNRNTVEWALGYKHPGNNRKERINNFINEFKSLKPCIWGSDAHSMDKLFEPDLQRYCWIKADPTFKGLKQIIYEPDERVFIGDEPELLQRIRENKTKFIKTIKINHIEGYDEKNGIWFKNIEIPLNHGMVAIIGNKGSGKSALLDIIALCGNSHQEEKDFSFLNENRFKKGRLAKNFKAVLEWENGEEVTKNLNGKTDKTAPERVKYLPQNYFERLTNSLDSYEFEETLNNVVFNHLPEEQKLGKSSFKELISYKKEMIEKEIKSIAQEIEVYNKKIIDLEKKEHPDYLEKIKNELELKKKELEEHEKNKPQEVSKPQEENENIKKLQELKETLEKNEDDIKRKNDENKSLLLEIEELNKIKQELNSFKKEIDNYIFNNQEKFKKYQLNSNNLIKIEVNTQLVEKRVDAKIKQRNDNSQKIKKLEENNKKIREEEKNIKSTLSEQQHKYEKYLTDLKKWENKKQEIIGDDKTPNTIKWYENEINFIKKELKERINTLRGERVSKSLEIYDKKKELVDIYKSLKDYVDKEISEYQNILGEYEINIEATLEISKKFCEKFLNFINQKVKGSFRGEGEGLKVLQELTKEINPTSKEEIKQFLNKIINYLEYDKREQFKDKEDEEERRFILDQISDENILKFYNYLFSLDYLNAIYQLQLGDKELTQLSPGEKGALLIVFYLMLDKDNIPLLIDQPEENLDNESIYKILTHFIRLTKNKRQIIIVTHNPNLAIVGDAEQIIFVNIDKKNGNKFFFKSGAIENPVINKHASDILEGTLKAFDLRRLKYFNKGNI